MRGQKTLLYVVLGLASKCSLCVRSRVCMRASV